MPGSEILVIGAGIAGLAHAWSAAECGHHVTVCERGPTARGASIRNFGMVWPIGQPFGVQRNIALHSRKRWLQLAEQASLEVEACGALLLAHHDDEWQVLREYQALAQDADLHCELLDANSARHCSPAVNPAQLRGGMFSPWELRVNPRQAIPAIAAWLAAHFRVRFEFNTTITDLRAGLARAADGREWTFARCVVCSGPDVHTLFPAAFQHQGLRLCKLQMLRTAPQPASFRLGPHLAGGLTLRHYDSFAVCPSRAALQQRIAATLPELDRFGIHGMASQDQSGALILGDSHEYDTAITPFDRQDIDELILRELAKVIAIPDWSLAERWHGIYLKPSRDCFFQATPLPGVHLFTGLGGNGMTLAFGLADRLWTDSSTGWEFPAHSGPPTPSHSC